MAKEQPAEIEHLRTDEIVHIRKVLRGERNDLVAIGNTRKFLGAFKVACEQSLYLFAKFVLDMPDLTPHLHKPVCDWVQCVDPAVTFEMAGQTVRGGRRKLLMLPVVHLKTSIGSHAFPLHVLIQPERANIYFHAMKGCDTRILLHGETVGKAKENISVVKQHLEHNRIFRHLWRHLCYPKPKDYPLWNDEMVTVRRDKILAEPSVTAIGIGTALEQRHYDVIIADDLATRAAAESEVIMESARNRRKTLRSRLNHLTNSIELGIGTHWTSNDIYIDWKKDPSVQFVVRAAIENGQPIWPQRHTLESLLAEQEETGQGKKLFSANYMNNPLNSAFSALDWGEVRYYKEQGGFAVFDLDDRDGVMLDREFAGSQFKSAYWTRKSEYTRGTPLDHLYPARDSLPEETEEQRALRRMARLQRKIATAQEGSQDWVRLTEVFARMRNETRLS